MRLKTWLLTCAIATVLPISALAQTPSTPSPSIVRGAAAAYADYQGQVSDIRAKPLAGADQLDKALDTFGAQNPDQLSSGWVS